MGSSINPPHPIFPSLTKKKKKGNSIEERERRGGGREKNKRGFFFFSAIYYPQRRFEKRGCPIEQFASFLFWTGRWRRGQQTIGGEEGASWPPEGIRKEDSPSETNPTFSFLFFFFFFKFSARSPCPPSFPFFFSVWTPSGVTSRLNHDPCVYMTSRRA